MNILFKFGIWADSSTFGLHRFATPNFGQINEFDILLLLKFPVKIVKKLYFINAIRMYN